MPAAPSPNTYPSAGSTIKPGKRNYNAILAATNVVIAVHMSAINSMGGAVAVATTVLSAINAVATCTVANVMMRMMQMMQMMQMQMSQANAIHAILLKLI